MQQRATIAAKTHRIKLCRRTAKAMTAKRAVSLTGRPRCRLSPRVMASKVTCRAGSARFPTYFEPPSDRYVPRASRSGPERKNTSDSFIEHRLSNSIRKTLTGVGRPKRSQYCQKRFAWPCLDGDERGRAEKKRELENDQRGYMMFLFCKWLLSFIICVLKYTQYKI